MDKKKITYANYKDYNPIIRKELEEFTQTRGISLYMLANQIGVVRETMRCFLIKKKGVSFTTLCKINQYLHENQAQVSPVIVATCPWVPLKDKTNSK